MLRGRLIRALNKKLVHIRWMGVRTAVYGSDFREKTECGGKPPVAKRGTKRRGKRSRNSVARKRRRLISADPVPVKPLLTKPPSMRPAYLESRYNKFMHRQLDVAVRLRLLRKRIDPIHGRIEARRRLHDAERELVTKLVAISARRSGDSLEFAKIRLGVVMRVKEMGWASLPRPDSSDIYGSEFFQGLPEFVDKLPIPGVKRIVSVTSTRIITREFIGSSEVIKDSPRRITARGVQNREAVGKPSGGRRPLATPSRTRPKGNGSIGLEPRACLGCGLVGSRRDDRCVKCRLGSSSSG
jgi:hypothetical protein